MRIVLLLTVLSLLAAGCGAGEVEEPDRAASPPEDPEEELYEATATVLEAPDGGPMLCLGPMLMSLPPQCGDIPIRGWSWDAVDGEQRHAGVRWGEFHVVGRYDGETFTLVEAGPPRFARAEPDEGLFVPPCLEPEGGWLADGTAASQADVDEAEGYARRQAEYVRSWVFHIDDPAALEEGGYEEDLPVVYVAVFTSEAARHEAELRARWDGPLCIVERDVPSAREAARIRTEAEASLDELGLRMLSSWEGAPGLAAELEVIADPGGRGQAALDERFGPGLVRLVPKLTPVD